MNKLASILVIVFVFAAIVIGLRYFGLLAFFGEMPIAVTEIDTSLTCRDTMLAKIDFREKYGDDVEVAVNRADCDFCGGIVHCYAIREGSANVASLASVLQAVNAGNAWQIAPARVKPLYGEKVYACYASCNPEQWRGQVRFVGKFKLYGSIKQQCPYDCCAASETQYVQKECPEGYACTAEHLCKKLEVPPPVLEVCGNGKCGFDEDCRSCPQDCGACPWVPQPEPPAVDLCENVDCDDGNPCTVDRCSASTGQCSHDLVADNTVCGTGKVCVNGACVEKPLEPVPPFDLGVLVLPIILVVLVAIAGFFAFLFPLR